MSYQKQFYAPQGWYEEQGLAPGQTPTNAEKAAAAATQLAYMIAHPELYVFDPVTKTWTKRTTAPSTTTLPPGVKTAAKVVGLGLLALTIVGVVYVARKL